MPTFAQLPDTQPLQEVINAAFDAQLNVSGGWGYTKDAPIVIHALPAGQNLPQMQHMLASMRCYLEMHMTLPKEKRYGSIKLNEIDRDETGHQKRTLHRVVYRVDAMKEEDYERFIEEYKQGYGKADFDLQAHFQRRKHATLQREIAVYFDVTEVD